VGFTQKEFTRMDHVVKMPLYSAEALVASATLTTPVIDTKFMSRIEGLVLKATSVLGDADVKVEFSTSNDPLSFPSFDNETDLIASTDALTAPEETTTVAVPTPIARYVKFKITELTGTVEDTLITLDLMFREQL
jgi:hypothetical protein